MSTILMFKGTTTEEDVKGTKIFIEHLDSMYKKNKNLMYYIILA